MTEHRVAIDEKVARATKRRRIWSLLYIQVLIAIAAGVALGALFPAAGAALQPLGDAFIRLVKMIVAPVIFLTVTTGIAGLSQSRSVGRMAVKTFTYFLTVSTAALILGMIVANLVQPGAGLNVDVATLDVGSVSTYAEKAHDAGIVKFLLDTIPTTLVSALTDGSILQVLLVAVLFGIALAAAPERSKPVLDLLESASDVVFRVVALVMRAAPLGAFGAIAFTVGKYGVSALVPLASLVATFYLTSLFFIVVILGAIARGCGFSMFALIRYLKEEVLLVLGTSSSEPALPSLLAKMEAAGCAKSVVGLVVPTGYSFNLDGTNIYMTLAALFIAQATGVDLSLGEQVALLLVAMISSKGAAGVTGAGFITLAATLSIVPAIPIAGLALILGIDRFMSECRAVTNFLGNAVATVVIAKWEGALDQNQLELVLAAGSSTSHFVSPSSDRDAQPQAPNID